MMSYRDLSDDQRRLQRDDWLRQLGMSLPEAKHVSRLDSIAEQVEGDENIIGLCLLIANHHHHPGRVLELLDDGIHHKYRATVKIEKNRRHLELDLKAVLGKLNELGRGEKQLSVVRNQLETRKLIDKSKEDVK